MKRIARELHVSRNTVRKILRSDETDFSYERERQPMPRIGPWQEKLDGMLLANAIKSSLPRASLSAGGGAVRRGPVPCVRRAPPVG